MAGTKDYLIKKSTPLRKLMAAHCKFRNLQVSQVRFMVAAGEGVGVPIEPNDTSLELGLEDGDVLVMFQVPPGGMLTS